MGTLLGTEHWKSTSSKPTSGLHCLCSCGTDKPSQTDQKPTDGFPAGWSEGILEIPYWHPLSEVCLGETWGFNAEWKPWGWADYPELNFTGSQWEKSLGLTVPLMSREAILLQGWNLPWSPVCVLLFIHLQCISEKEKELVEQGPWWNHLLNMLVWDFKHLCHVAIASWGAFLGNVYWKSTF